MKLSDIVEPTNLHFNGQLKDFVSLEDFKVLCTNGIKYDVSSKIMQTVIEKIYKTVESTNINMMGARIFAIDNGSQIAYISSRNLSPESRIIAIKRYICSEILKSKCSIFKDQVSPASSSENRTSFEVKGGPVKFLPMDIQVQKHNNPKPRWWNKTTRPIL